MRQLQPRSALVLALLTLISGTLFAASIPPNRRPLKKRAVPSDVPLVVFQSMDERLTALDADNQAVRVAIKRMSERRSAASRRRSLRQIQRSREFRNRLQTVNQMLAISQRAEQRYKARRQQYGALLFRDLHRKLAALRRPMLEARAATTTSVFEHDEKLANTRVLPVIEQFQSISGGYAALACHPGSWACCKPRVTREGKIELRGCAWSCASRLTACRGGCLGPRIPNTVVAVKNAAPPSRAAQRRTLAAAQARKSKAGQRAAVPAKTTGSSGSE